MTPGQWLLGIAACIGLMCLTALATAMGITAGAEAWDRHRVGAT